MLPFISSYNLPCLSGKGDNIANECLRVILFEGAMCWVIAAWQINLLNSGTYNTNQGRKH